MKRSKTQAVYKYLPGMWISERVDGKTGVSALIKAWNYIKMEDIYGNFIEHEIRSQIKLFKEKGGDVSSFNESDGVTMFQLVEPACNENVPDIVSDLSPLVYYCSSCHRAFQAKSGKDAQRFSKACPVCNKKTVKQLQMVYTCECGHAEPIRLPGYGKDYYYNPTEERFKMYHKSGMNHIVDEMRIVCPVCGSSIVPDNANAGRNFKPFTIHIINLVDEKAGTFYEKGVDAQKTIVAKWFDRLPQDKYIEILGNVELAFDPRMSNSAQRKKVEEQVDALINSGLYPKEMREAAISTMMKTNKDDYSISNCIQYFDSLNIPSLLKDGDDLNNWLNQYSFKLMEYETLRNPKRFISLEDIINNSIKLESINEPGEIYNLNKMLGIADVQISLDIGIINCTYGYTRRSSDPANSTNSKCSLKLNAFGRYRDTDKRLAYGSKLDTEGILFNIDMVKILEWLLINGVINEYQMPDTDDSESVKKWFLENVHGNAISIFGEIDPSETITKNVFALLHSMSHAFLKTAGEISGLADNSLSEMIFVETASIFIYSQSTQGIPLGSLSGMAETRYKLFLEKTLEANRQCIFDPICTDRDDTACMACLILPEITCHHFNAELGRKYLYTIKSDSNSYVGFWDMNNSEVI